MVWHAGETRERPEKKEKKETKKQRPKLDDWAYDCAVYLKERMEC